MQISNIKVEKKEEATATAKAKVAEAVEAAEEAEADEGAQNIINTAKAIAVQDALSQPTPKNPIGGSHSKKNNRITKRGGGGFVQTLMKTGELVGDTTAIATMGVAHIAKEATATAVSAVSSAVTTSDAAIQGSLAVITAVFNTLITIFAKLPDDFNGIVLQLKLDNNLAKKKKLARKLIHLFKKIIKIIVRSLNAILKEYYIFDREVQNKYALTMKLFGCTRTLTNRAFRNKYAYTCPDMNALNQQVGRKLNRIKLQIKAQLEYIEGKLKTDIARIKDTTNPEHLSKLESMLATKSDDPLLLGFMAIYKKEVDQPIFELKQLLSLKSNTEINSLLNGLNELLKAHNAQINAPVNPILNAPVNKGIVRKRVGEHLHNIFAPTNSEEEKQSVIVPPPVIVPPVGGGRKSTKYRKYKSRRRR